MKAKRTPRSRTLKVHPFKRQAARDAAAERRREQERIWRDANERVATMRRLNKLTYAVQHNPNCASPFLVRLCGSSIIDLRPASETRDILGYGKTLVEAGAEALRKYGHLMKDPLRKGGQRRHRAQ